MKLKRSNVLGLTGAIVCALALVGCSTGTPDSASSSPTPTPSASPAVEKTTRLTTAELGSIFTGIQFVPGEYGDTSELIDSIYPGLEASDLSCLSPFGVGWDTDAATDTTVEFGTSNDRSMTAVVSSSDSIEAATSLLEESTAALTRCAEQSGIFTMQGAPVATTLEQTEPTLTGTDEAIAWRVSGDVAGSPFTLVGITARVGGNAIALVGWDPATNEKNVPLATQMFVDEL